MASKLVEWLNTSTRNLSIVGKYGLDSGLKCVKQWCIDRNKHNLDVAADVSEALDTMTQQNGQELMDTVESLEDKAIVLIDGNILQFENVVDDDYTRKLLVWYGNGYETLTMTRDSVEDDYHWLEDHAYLQFNDKRDQFSDMVDEYANSAKEQLDYYNMVATAYVTGVKDDAAIIATGLQSRYDEVKELANALSSTVNESRPMVFLAYFKDLMTRYSSKLTHAIAQDSDNGSFSLADYDGQDTANLITGAWDLISNGAKMIGSILMVVGGAALKLVGAVINGAAWIFDQFKSYTDSKEYMTINPEVGRLFSNGVPIIWPDVNEYPAKDLTISSPYGDLMMTSNTSYNPYNYDPIYYPHSAIFFPSALATYPYVGFMKQSDVPHGLWRNGIQEEWENGYPPSINASPFHIRCNSSNLIEYNENLDKNVIYGSSSTYGTSVFTNMDDLDQSEAEMFVKQTIIGNIFSWLWRLALKTCFRVIQDLPGGVSPSFCNLDLSSFNDFIAAYEATTSTSSQYAQTGTEAFEDKDMFGNTSDSDTYGIELAGIHYIWSISQRGACWNIDDPDSRWADHCSWHDLYELMTKGVRIEDPDEWVFLVRDNSEHSMTLPGKVSSGLNLVLQKLICTILNLYAAKYMFGEDFAKDVLGEVVSTSVFTDSLRDYCGFGYFGAAPDSQQLSMMSNPVYIEGAYKFVPDDDIEITDGAGLPSKAYITPPKYARGTILGVILGSAAVVLAATIATIVIKKKWQNHVRAKMVKKEQAAINSFDNVKSMEPGTSEYKAAMKDYIKKQKKFQRYASKTGYSSNSVGSFTSGVSIDPSEETTDVFEKLQSVYSEYTGCSDATEGTLDTVDFVIQLIRGS